MFLNFNVCKKARKVSIFFSYVQARTNIIIKKKSIKRKKVKKKR